MISRGTLSSLFHCMNSTVYILHMDIIGIEWGYWRVGFVRCSLVRTIQWPTYKLPRWWVLSADNIGSKLLRTQRITPINARGRTSLRNATLGNAVIRNSNASVSSIFEDGIQALSMSSPHFQHPVTTGEIQMRRHLLQMKDRVVAFN